MLFMFIRPLPEEEELDEFFAGTCEETDPGNHNNMLHISAENFILCKQI